MLTDQVNVAPHRALKKDWFLRNDAKTGSQIVKSESRDVDTMNNNTSSSRLDQPKQNLIQSLFPPPVLPTTPIFCPP